MRRKLPLMMISLLLLFALMFAAGCKTEAPPDGTVDTTRPEGEKEQIIPQEPAAVYGIAFDALPETVHSGEYFTLSWKVDSTPPSTITSTNLFYGPEPTGKEYTLETAKDEHDYESSVKTFTQGSFDVPQTFTTKIQAPESGTLYLKAHVYAVGKNYWTDEMAIAIDDTQKLSCSGVYRFIDGVCCLDIEVPVGECDTQPEESTVEEDAPEEVPDTEVPAEEAAPSTPTEDEAALEELRKEHPGAQETKLIPSTPILYKNILRLEVFYKIKSNDAPFSGGICTADLFGKYPYNVIPWQSEQRSFWKQALTNDLPKGDVPVVIECYDPLGKYQAQRVVVTVTIA